MKHLWIILLFLGVISCKEAEKKDKYSIPSWNKNYEAISLLGDTLYSKNPSEKLMQAWRIKKVAFEENPDNLDNLIWYGRFTAYKGAYRKAIKIYSEGLLQFPNESRLLRHRGHRYISIREFDKAIADLELAKELIQNKENKVEEDGMPNAQNIPVSTQHGNIYYHLGLAYYLKGNLKEAASAYEQCLATSPNPDNVVSATHWLYMIARKSGDKEKAEAYLNRIDTAMTIIENQAYHQACLFYKGLLPMDSIYNPNAEATASNSAVKYAIANWHNYNEEPEKARALYENILQGNDWASFGFIAAEIDRYTYE